MTYRKGAIGAMTDIYENILNDFIHLLKTIPEDKFLKSLESNQEDFQSIKNITLHVINSGYIYSNYVRKSFGSEITNHEFELNSVNAAVKELNKMFQYKLETYENKWLMTDDEMMKTIIKTSWSTFDLEAIIEHSIVHILRHQLQIKKIIE